MTPEKQALLFTRYPLIFRQLVSQAGSYQGELAVEDGWFAILDSLCATLYQNLRQAENELGRLERGVGQPLYAGSSSIVYEAMIEDARIAAKKAYNDLPVASQVKEKFGRLRFYVGPVSAEARAMIRLAEAMSGHTCERCGATEGAMTYGLGWNRTLCPVHADAEYGPEKAGQARQQAHQRSATP